jgi:glycine/D-amino acid oxidase-like deaminating enzyme
VVPETLANALASSFPHETLDAADVRRRSPAVAVADDATALFDPRAGVVSPEQAVTAQLRLAARAGAVLRFDETILDVSVSGDSVSVRTNLGSYGAKRLVLCTGAWSPGLLPGRVPLLRVQRQVQHWFEVPADRTAMFDPEKFPVHVWEDAELFYCMPMLDGPGGGVKCCVELDPPPLDEQIADEHRAREATAAIDVQADRVHLAIEQLARLLRERHEQLLAEAPIDEHADLGARGDLEERDLAAREPRCARGRDRPLLGVEVDEHVEHVAGRDARRHFGARPAGPLRSRGVRPLAARVRLHVCGDAG